ncbi:RNA polymerase subunit sigma-70 [Cellulomonas sp. URHE0023]|uniref:RNA polymerase subunit sigma-70 n=1 Tax=Cellulomonas sp. URHE0023 TaxID=1380354 RepID=UPI000486B6D5|nr:RNA polymerase subunit sigma-70 [Cellulomonas sp. URHE0023]
MADDVVERSTDDALRAMVDAHRRELHVHCYRMLGSVADADDALQETLLAAWRGLDRFDGRSSARTWLYRIATNCCLNLLRTRGRRPVTEPLPPFDPPPPSRRSDLRWLQPYPDVLLDETHEPGARHLADESIALAFVSALQAMPPRQVAALLLVDVLGFSLGEVAKMLDASPTAVKGVLQRARAVTARPTAQPARSVQDDDGLAVRFARAYAADDVEGVVALLTDEAWLAMPPAAHVYEGRDAVHAFLAASAAGRGSTQQLVATRANRQPAFACYRQDAAGAATFTGVVVLTTTPAGISGITRFLDASLAPTFGLRARL